MKKIKLNNIAAYIIGQMLLSIGIVLAVKSNLGITVATSPAYVFSCMTDVVSFGTFNYLYQGFIFLLMLLVIREIRLRYFLSFLSAVIFGYTIDGCTFMLRQFSLQAFSGRVGVFIFSIFIMCLGVSTFLVSGLPLLPFDIFVRKISAKFGFRFSSVKLVFDLSNLFLAVAVSLLFFGRLVGVYWGTLFFGLLLGPGIGVIMKLFERSVVITGRLPAFVDFEN